MKASAATDWKNDQLALYGALYGGGCEGCPAERADLDIAAALHRELDDDPAIPSEAIDVSVEGGWTILSGEVGSWTVREHAEAAALHTEGVTCLEDRLAVIAG